MSVEKVGDLLIERKLISPENLQEALELQKVYPDQPVGQLLCRLGYIKDSDLRSVLDQKNKRRKLSEILLKNQIISPQKLSQAHEASKKSNIPLEKALLNLGYVDEEQLAQALASQYDLPYVKINSLNVDPSLSRFINAAYAQKHQIVPISKIGNTLTLAMAEPLRNYVLMELEDSIRLRIISVIASESSILSVLSRLYNLQTSTKTTSENSAANLDILPENIDNLLNLTTAQEEPEIEEETRKVTEKDSIIVRLVNKIVYDAYVQKASDIHVEPYPGKKDVVIRIRVDGQCSIYQNIPYKYKYALVSRVKIMAQLDIAERRKPQDGKIEFKKFGPLDIELRIATIPTVGGLEDVVIRLLPGGEPIAFEQLGLSARNLGVFDQSVRSPYGLVLVVGPTGSGKTTTLHSGLARINTNNRKIWTAEDPVEITQAGLRQVQVNSRIGFTFANALRAFLRADPDVIMVGEMRDVETASTAIEASLTGHLVFSTLHTNTAPETVTRLLEMGMDPFSFSDALLCVLAQRLARRLCNDCKEGYRPGDAEIEELINEYGHDFFAETGINRADLMLYRVVGCDSCGHIGYKGRLGVHEILECTDKLKVLIKKRAVTDIIRQQSIKDGMTTLKQDGIIKVLHGLTDIHEIRRVCIK